jgi:archaellin
MMLLASQSALKKSPKNFQNGCVKAQKQRRSWSVADTVPAKRTFTYTLSIECASEGNADMKAVENILDLHFQDLVMDDTFVNELDESQAVTIQVVPNFGQK